ncbi:hypothetical protein FRC18_008311 [Serendipita sp. 400]|nr:hypothetical protein FRC18_008311 [Serendipita sp. 400]
MLYVVKIGDEEFRFTQDQLDSEPGNYLANHFLQGVNLRSDAAEVGDRNLLLEKDPLLFRLIQAHLRGYEVLPIPDSSIPGYMTKESAVENLMRDARSLGLRRLEQKMAQYQMSLTRGTQVKLPIAQKKYKLATLKGTWRAIDITETGFKTLLERFINARNFQPFLPENFELSGYTIAVCWRDVNESQASEKGITTYGHGALLESND